MTLARSALLPLSLALLAIAPTPKAGDTDPIGAAWRGRAALATKRLAGSKLDACDRALEEGFKGAKDAMVAGKRMVHVVIEIGGRPMMAGWAYHGSSLDEFTIATLPDGWIAIQHLETRTLSVVVGGASCAFDLCTTDPMADGPCPGKPAH